MTTSTSSAGSRWAARLVVVLLVAATVALVRDAHAEGAPVEQATAAQKAKARMHFQKGKMAFDAGKHEQALTELRASYDIVASPNSLIMIAQVLDAMGRSAEAYGEASAVVLQAEAEVARDPKYEKTAEAARQLRDSIRPHVGLLTVKVPSDAEGPVTINGKEFPREYWNLPVPVMPGPITVQLGAEPAKEVSLEPGAEVTVDLNPPPPAPPPPPPPPPPVREAEAEGGSGLGAKGIIGIVSGGVGVLGLLTFSIFGLMTNSTYSSIELRCPTKTDCPGSVQNDIDAGQAFQTVANVSLAVGIVGIAAGTGLLVWDLAEPDEPGGGDDGRDDGSELAIIRPRLEAGPGSLLLRGSF